MLAATSGAITLSNLPERWSKPVVIKGTLPALAQTSPAPPAPTPTVDLGTPPNQSNCRLTGPIGSCNSGGGQAGQIYLITCEYTDPDGNVLPNEARLRVTFDFPSGASSAQEAALDPINIDGNGFSGEYTVPLCIGFAADPRVDITLALIDSNRLESNIEMVTIIAPKTTTAESETQPWGRVTQ